MPLTMRIRSQALIPPREAGLLLTTSITSAPFSSGTWQKSLVALISLASWGVRPWRRTPMKGWDAWPVLMICWAIRLARLIGIAKLRPAPGA